MRIKQFSKRKSYIKPFTKKFSQAKTTLLNHYIPRDYISKLLKNPAKRDVLHKLIFDELTKAAARLAKGKAETLQWKYKTKDRNEIIDNLISDIYVNKIGPVLKDLELKGYESKMEGTYKLPYERESKREIIDRNTILLAGDIEEHDGIRQAMCPTCKAVGESISLWPNSAENPMDAKQSPDPIRHDGNKYCGNWKEIGKDISKEKAEEQASANPKYRKIISKDNKDYLSCTFVNNLTPFSYYIKNVSEHVYWSEVTDTYKKESPEVSLDAPVGGESDDKERFRGIGIENVDPEKITEYSAEIHEKIKKIVGDEKDYALLEAAIHEEGSFANVLKPGGGDLYAAIEKVANRLLNKGVIQKILGQGEHTQCIDCGKLMFGNSMTCTEADKLRELLYSIYTSMPDFDAKEFKKFLNPENLNKKMVAHFRAVGTDKVVNSLKRLFAEIEVEEMDEEEVTPPEFEVVEDFKTKKVEEVEEPETVEVSDQLFKKTVSFCRIQKQGKIEMSKYEFDKKMMDMIGDKESYLGTKLDKRNEGQKDLYEETKERLERSMDKIRKNEDIREQFIDLIDLVEKAETRKMTQI